MGVFVCTHAHARDPISRSVKSKTKHAIGDLYEVKSKVQKNVVKFKCKTDEYFRREFVDFAPHTYKRKLITIKVCTLFLDVKMLQKQINKMHNNSKKWKPTEMNRFVPHLASIWELITQINSMQMRFSLSREYLRLWSWIVLDGVFVIWMVVMILFVLFCLGGYKLLWFICVRGVIVTVFIKKEKKIIIDFLRFACD